MKNITFKIGKRITFDNGQSFTTATIMKIENNIVTLKYDTLKEITLSVETLKELM